MHCAPCLSNFQSHGITTTNPIYYRVCETHLSQYDFVFLDSSKQALKTSAFEFFYSGQFVIMLSW